MLNKSSSACGGDSDVNAKAGEEDGARISREAYDGEVARTIANPGELFFP